MRADMFAHLSDSALLQRGSEIRKQKRTIDATFLLWIAEVDARKVYLPAAHPSMLSYCEHVLRLSRDSALKNIHVARAARRFPLVLEALVEGRIHSTGVRTLAPHLTPENVEGLLRAAEKKTAAEIELLTAERFPRSELLPMVHATPTPLTQSALAKTDEASEDNCQGVAYALRHTQSPGPRPRVAPLSGESFELHFSITRKAHDKLLHAQTLLSHRVGPGELGEIFEQALDALIARAEKTKRAATDRPQRAPRSSSNPRHIPAHVRRAVWKRDESRCTFVAENGERCPARTHLELDHILPVARGGTATVENLRLRCRGHNQYEAERMFGEGFMAEKREQAERVEEVRSSIPVETPSPEEAEEGQPSVQAIEYAEDVMCGLRNLGFRADQARRAAKLSMTLPDDVPLEERMRVAIRSLCANRSRAPIELSVSPSAMQLAG